jgi:diaminohydroxyphosphoribosylaminopyrimidine deaminase/5-amino-6-(5-phosphoribosylamino)uracil reductase
MPDSSADLRFIQRALELARMGIGLASPNPHVGAVVVDAGHKIVGEGTHKFADRKHAEVIAIEQAGQRARGATLYLNLEPCCHTGRTGPCSDAVITAGIRRVVASMTDPNPLVASKGFDRLRAAGIEVTIGPGEADAKKINEGFTKYIRTRTPLVTLKTAMTLDGKIAPPPSESANPTALGAAEAARGWITGQAARAHVHLLRHEHDAILVGVGTVIADDPLLTDRSGRARRRPLLRVVLDSHLRTPPESRLIATANNDVALFYCSADEHRRNDLERHGVCVQRVACRDGRPDLREVMTRLGQMEITSVLVEGGSQVNGAALAAGVVDKLFLYYAPRILGEGAVPFLPSDGFGTENDGLSVRNITLHRFGEDFAVEGYVRDPYA